MADIHIFAPRGTPTRPTLHLMPFHIAHDGPAPLSTYFLIQPAPPPSSCPSAEAPSTCTSDSSSSYPSTSSQTAIDSNVDPPAAEEKKSSLKERFISSFRGRSLKGLHLPLPQGYTGVLLRSSLPPPSKPPRPTSLRTSSPSKRRTRKRAASPIPVPDSDDEGFNLGEGGAQMEQMEDDKPRKELRVEGVFEGFVLWGADVEVDVGGDAYAAALGEWWELGKVIHDTRLGVDEVKEAT